MKEYDPIENGKRLRIARGDKSIEKVADAVGISAASLAMYESGKRNPRDEIKVRLCNYLKVTVQKTFYT